MPLRLLFLLGAFIAALTTSAAGAVPRCDLGAGSQRVAIDSTDGPRQLLVYIPVAALDGRPPPLLLNLHGSGGNGDEQMRASQLSPLADRHGFVIAAPDGGVLLPRGGHAWNLPGIPTVAGTLPPPDARDDIGYVGRIVDALVARGCADPRRVYVTGISGGGRMASLLACRLADHITAIAPVVGLRAGTPLGEPAMPDPASCQPARPVAVIAFSGGADHTNPPGGGGAGYWRYGLLAAEQRWAELDGCAGTPKVKRTRGQALTVRRYRKCSAPVESHVLATAGHAWAAVDVDAMWAFLSKQVRAR